MAEALNITDLNFAGENADYMLTPAVIDIDTIKKGAIAWVDNIKKEFSLPIIDVTNVMQKRAATPVSSGSITVSRRLLVPQFYMSYLEFNPLDFQNHWFSKEMGAELIDAPLPVTAESYLLYQLGKRINEFNENQIWRGRMGFDPANGGLSPASVGQVSTDSQFMYFDGLVNKLLNDGNTLTIAGTTVTDSNILSVLQTVYETIPISILNRMTDVKFLMSYSTHRYYNVALTNLTYKDTFNTDATKQQYKGYEVLPLAGLPDNTIIAALAIDNNDASFWLGVNSEKNSMQLKFDKVSAPSELWFVKMLMKADVNYSFAGQVVLYTNITSSPLFTPVQ